MTKKLESLINEIIDEIDESEIKETINFEKYKRFVLKYVKNVDNNLIEEAYNVIIFEIIYIYVLIIIIGKMIEYKFNIKYSCYYLLKKIDNTGVFSEYNLEKKYIEKIESVIINEKYAEHINQNFFIEFYEKNIDKNYKKILGQFYTPKIIVKEMLKNVRINEKTKILDPACGAGIFLIEIIDKYKKNHIEKSLIEFINTNLYANDINPFAIIMTKLNILMKVINICSNPQSMQDFFEKEEIFNNIKLKDTLSDMENTKFDLIIGNPPFFKMTKEQIKKYSGNFINSFGQTNIYELFIYWAMNNIEKEGIIKYIIPQSFKSGLYFKNMRKELSKYYISSIININNTKNIFCDVEQAVLVITIKNNSSKGKKTEIKLFDVINNEMKNKYIIDNKKLFNLSNDSYEINIAQTKEEYDILEKINENKSIKLLNKSGYKFANGLFVWNQNKNIINEKKSNIPIIYGDYIQKEMFEFNSVIKNKEKKRFCENDANISKLILYGKKLIIQRTSTFSQKNRLNAAIISQDFLNNYKCYFIENHVNFLIKDNDKQKEIDDKTLYFYWAIINSDLVNWMFKIKSGNTQISTTELNLLPICEYNDKIYQLAKEYNCSMNEKTKEKLQTEIYMSYGLNKKEISIIKGECCNG